MVVKKTNNKIFVKALDVGIIGFGYHIYQKKPKENYTISKEDEKYISIINEGLIDFVAISFADNFYMINDLKSKLHNPNSVKILAKIETIFGVNNMEFIVENTTSLIVARDDLSVRY